MRILVKLLHTETSFDLGVELAAGEMGLMREIRHQRVQKPGLAIAGFVETVRPACIQVMGETEMGCLESLEEVAQVEAIEGLLGSRLACVVVTSGQRPPPALLSKADELAVPVFITQLPSERFINRAHNFLDEHLSPEITIHGVIVDVFGVGVILSGQSGIGKSECALDLVLRGHRLVADDVILVKQLGRELEAMGSPLTRHHMEVRGLGIINVRDLFGAAAVRERKRVDLLVEMVEWQVGAEYDRTGLDDVSEHILDSEIPKIRLPIRPGRNVASIVEVAARNHLLKQQGHDAAKEFEATVERRLLAGARGHDDDGPNTAEEH